MIESPNSDKTLFFKSRGKINLVKTNYLPRGFQ